MLTKKLRPDNTGSACCHLVQNSFPSRFIFMNMKMKRIKNIMLSVFCIAEKLNIFPKSEHRLEWLKTKE
jgi:hypothetical protein